MKKERILTTYLVVILCFGLMPGCLFMSINGTNYDLTTDHISGNETYQYDDYIDGGNDTIEFNYENTKFEGNGSVYERLNYGTVRRWSFKS